MKHVSLTLDELFHLFKLFLGLTGILASIAVAVQMLFGANFWHAVPRSITGALSLASAIAYFLLERPWRSERIALVTGRPIVHGLWIGTLTSDYKDKQTGQTVPPVRIAFVIRQTYLRLSVESFTKAQDGSSCVEAFSKDAKTSIAWLRYIFELRRQYAGENKLTSGAGELKLIDGGTRLKGVYWTNSPTQGTIDLEFIARDCEDIGSFEAAERKYREVNTQSLTQARC